MALRVWLPLNGNLNNKGLSNVTVTNSGATVSTAGKIGSCYSFDGSDDYISLSDSVLYSIFRGITHEFSVAFWIYHADSTRAIIFGDYGLTGAISLNIELGTDHKVRFYWNGSPDKTFAESSVDLNTWTHICITYNGSKVMLYKNGVKVADEYTGILAEKNKTSGVYYIGRDSRTGTTAFNGKLNDFRLYDHCLSPKEVKELSKGLVLHYKLDDKYLEGTTNLITSQDCLSGTCYNGATGKYGYGSTTDIYKTTGIFEGKFCTKVYMGTNGNSAYPYVYVSDLYVSNGTNAPEYKTLSFDYFCTIGTYIGPYKLGDGTSTCTWINEITSSKTGIYTNSGYIPVIPGIWNHIVMILHGTTDVNAQWGYIRLGSGNHTSDTSNYWLFANMQLETKDHETGYVKYNSTRSNSIVYDCSGYDYNGTITGSIAISTDASRYNYSTLFGSSNYISPSIFPSFLTNEATVSMWVKLDQLPPSSPGRTMLYTAWYGLSCEITSGGKTYFRTNLTSGSCDSPQGTISVGNWVHWVGVKSPTGVSLYLNGTLVGTTSNSNNFNWSSNSSNKIGSYSSSYFLYGKLSDLRLYSTVLSSDDIKDLYNVAGVVDNNKNTHGYELLEYSENLLFTESYGIANKTWSGGLSKYTQTHCQCTLTDTGYRIYRTPDLVYPDAGTVMWGGFVIDNANNRYGFKKGHTYILQFEIKGQTSNGVGDIYWTCQVGWGGGEIAPSPSNVQIINPVTSNYNSSEWKTFTYKWTINDEVYKTCTASYNGNAFVEGNTYVSYRGFKYGFSYANTGSLGTDLYIKNLVMIDITGLNDITVATIFKIGVIRMNNFIENNVVPTITPADIMISDKFIEI